MCHFGVIELKDGLDLYHLTPIVTEELVEDQPYLEKYLGTYSDDLKYSKYFSLSVFHPLYYGWEEGVSVALHYVTKKSIILADLRGLESNYQLMANFRKCIMNTTSIDGWIMRDDADDDWYEVFLTRPEELISKEYEIMNYIDEEVSTFKKLLKQTKLYPYGKDERDTIQKYTLMKGMASFRSKPRSFKLTQQYIERTGAKTIVTEDCEIILFPA